MNQKHSGTESRLQGAVDREERFESTNYQNFDIFFYSVTVTLIHSKTLTGAERWEIIRRKWLEPPNESKGNYSARVLQLIVCFFMCIFLLSINLSWYTCFYSIVP